MSMCYFVVLMGRQIASAKLWRSLEIWCSVFSDYERYFYDVVKTLYRANGCRREMFNSAVVLPKRKRSLESAGQALKGNLS